MANTDKNGEQPEHFKGKDALGHVIEAQAQGIIANAEIHGIEMPGYLFAASDAARQTAVALPLIWLLMKALKTVHDQSYPLLIVFSLSWLLWTMGRSAWLGWFRLERLHRILEQERWEIENHRQQERDELRELYAAKGFEGKLLEDVLDVLMADNDRLLKVMVEEELGLSLGTHEHPLKQGIGAAVGVFISAFVCLFALIVWPDYGIFLGCFLMICFSSVYAARLANNETIPAVIWNLSLTFLVLGFSYFLIALLKLNI